MSPGQRDALLHHLLANMAEDALFALDPRGRIATWGAGAQRVLGYPEEEAVGRPFALLYPRERVRDDEPERALRLAREDGRFEGEAEWARADGSPLRVEVRVDILHEGEEHVGYGVLAHDLTDRIAAQEAVHQLRLSEAKFAGIISISTDAIVSVDGEQRIVLFNQGAEQIFGYTAEEVMGEPLELLVPERFRGPHAEQVRTFGRSPVPARRMGERGQISGRRKNGEVFPADASISKLRVDGRMIYTAVLRDVTARVRAEEELAARTEELERSNAELEQFAYVASHDLQEPLRMVASYTQLLARRYRERLDADAEEFIGYAVDGVTRMQQLIGDLLAFSRVGTRGAAFEPTDAEAVLRRVLVSLGPAMEEAGAVVTHDPLPTVVADPGQMGQLFQNLLTNALKFRGERPPRAHVSAERGDGGWVFSVRDNGIGIAPEYAERIFVIFQRLHTRSEYPGTGIGLAICKKIVERHGGRIWFTSAPGEGTTFYFTIPDRETDP